MASDTGEWTHARVIRLQVIQGNEGDAFTEQVHRNISERNKGVVRVGDTLEFQVGEGRFQIRVEGIGSFTLLTSDIEYDCGPGKGMMDAGTRLLDAFDPLVVLLSPALTTFIIFSPEATDVDHAFTLLAAYSQQLLKPKLGVGVVAGCLFSLLESGDGGRQFNKHYFVSPIRSSHDPQSRGLHETVECIKTIAVQTAQLSKLHSSSNSFFSALKPGETEISERTESFLWNLMKLEPIGLEELESWLGYIVEREASLSAMISAMRGNLIEAQSTVSRIEEAFRRLNERSINGEPRSTEGEVRAYNRIPKNYEDYLMRSEALKARLETVMDSVRTYLSIQQQKLTLEEQKASREQLTRLVRLQETLHKLEVIIVAVYILEMARIVFEVVAHEQAGVLSVVFIPIALLLSVAISRVLSKEH